MPEEQKINSAFVVSLTDGTSTRVEDPHAWDVADGWFCVYDEQNQMLFAAPQQHVSYAKRVVLAARPSVAKA